MLIRVDSCWTRFDSCRTRVDLCWLMLTRVDLCWHSFIKIDLILKELQNCIFRIIRAWSLFCSIRIHASLHFLLILSKNLIFCLAVFCIFCLYCFKLGVIFIDSKHLSNQSLCNQVPCDFALNLYKLFVKTKKSLNKTKL